MAKRRSPEDESDVEELPAASTSKRQRRTAADSDDEDAPVRKAANGKGKGKAKRATNADGDYEMGEDTVDAEEETRFEAEHGEFIRKQVEGKAKGPTVAVSDQSLHSRHPNSYTSQRSLVCC
jgi:hypothetical protein